VRLNARTLFPDIGEPRELNGRQWMNDTHSPSPAQPSPGGAQ
jgi:hypothetical protein